jgi:hypothetical protein
MGRNKREQAIANLAVRHKLFHRLFNGNSSSYLIAYSGSASWTLKTGTWSRRLT